MYVPNPIRCRKCFRLGHFADSCSNEHICAFCSKPDHKDLPCESFAPLCVNCNGPHPSLDIKCPKFLEEKEIKMIQFREKITYFAAKKLHRDSLPALTNKSFSEIARNTRKGREIGCQTDDCISADRNSTELIKSTISNPRSITGLSPHSSTQTPSPPLPTPTLPSNAPLPLIPSTSPDPQPPGVKQGGKIPDVFKTPPMPRRNSDSGKNRQGRSNIKGKKGENKKSGDEMETT